MKKPQDLVVDFVRRWSGKTEMGDKAPAIYGESYDSAEANKVAQA